MRIISGKYKSKRLTAPKKLPVRPTTDFAKEALFNILNNDFYFDDITVLDLLLAPEISASNLLAEVVQTLQVLTPILAVSNTSIKYQVNLIFLLKP